MFLWLFVGTLFGLLLASIYSLITTPPVLAKVPEDDPPQPAIVVEYPNQTWTLPYDSKEEAEAASKSIGQQLAMFPQAAFIFTKFGAFSTLNLRAVVLQED